MDSDYFKTRQAVLECLSEFSSDRCCACGSRFGPEIFSNQDYDRFVAELSRKGYRIFKEILP